MTRPQALPWLVFCTLLNFGGASAVAAPPSGPGVRTEHIDGWERLDAVLPGSLVSYALPRVEGGQRQIVLLVRPAPEDASETAGADKPALVPPCRVEPAREQQPLVLYRIESSAPDGLLVLHDGLPHDITAIDTFDADGDGSDELLLARDGELFLLDAQGDGEIESVLSEPELRWRSLEPRLVRAPGLDGWPAVQTHAYGKLAIHGPVGGEALWTRLASVDLPLTANVSSSGMRIRSMLPRFIGRTSDGTLLFATPAETHDQRLHTKLFEITTNGDVKVTDSWSRLPAPEMVLEQHFLMLDGHPILLVTTKTSEKLNVFGEKLLRLFPVKRDLSRLGRNPLFATPTRMNLWQQLTPFVVDVDGDAVDDLVLGYWKGLKDDRIVLDAYLRSNDGSFGKKVRTTAFDVDDADRSFVEYGRDLDGDGLADLLLRTEDGRLWSHAGLPAAAGEKLVRSEPRELPFVDEPATTPSVITISIGGASVQMAPTNPPRFADLDGDGRSEVLLVFTGRGERPGRFVALSTPGAARD